MFPKRQPGHVEGSCSRSEMSTPSIVMFDDFALLMPACPSALWNSLGALADRREVTSVAAAAHS